MIAALVIIAVVVAVPTFLWIAYKQNEKRKANARQVAASAGLNIDLDTKDPPATPSI